MLTYIYKNETSWYILQGILWLWVMMDIIDIQYNVQFAASLYNAKP